MLLLIPETEVSIIAPGSPGDIVLLEDGQHILRPLVSQLTVNGLINTPFATEQLQVVLLGCSNGILEVLTNLVDVPYLLGILLQQRLDAVGSSLIVLLGNKDARIVHLTRILADGSPPSTVVSKNHGVVIVEREDDVLVVLGNFQILHRLIALPAVAANDQCALGLTLTQCLVNLHDELIPLLVVIGYGLVHELIGHRVIAITLQHVTQLIPHVDEVLLGFLVLKQRIGAVIALVHGIEIVRTDDVQVNDGTQMVLLSHIDGVGHQLPGLRQLVALLIPELHLVNRQTYEVEAQLLQTLEVVLLDMLATGLATLL